VMPSTPLAVLDQPSRNAATRQPHSRTTARSASASSLRLRRRHERLLEGFAGVHSTGQGIPQVSIANRNGSRKARPHPGNRARAHAAVHPTGRSAPPARRTSPSRKQVVRRRMPGPFARTRAPRKPRSGRPPRPKSNTPRSRSASGAARAGRLNAADLPGQGRPLKGGRRSIAQTGKRELCRSQGRCRGSCRSSPRRPRSGRL